MAGVGRTLIQEPYSDQASPMQRQFAEERSHLQTLPCLPSEDQAADAFGGVCIAG
jgi:hypothetical protein